MVDVKKLLSQLERSEKSRCDTESRFDEAVRTLADVKEANERHSSIRDKLQSEVKDLRKRLRATEDEHKKTLNEANRYFNALQDVYSRVSPHVQRSSKDKSSSSSSSSSTSSSSSSSTAATATSEVKEEKEEATVNGKVKAETD